MLFKTGEQMAYSNTGYVLLGKVIEVVSGKSYGDYIETEFFQKLGMNNSQYGGRQLVHNRASGYTEHNNAIENASLIDMSWPHAAGSLISTVEDLAIWNDALVSGKAISKNSYQKMISPYKLTNGDRSPYGYGLSLYKVREFEAIGHGGGITGFSTNSVYLPQKDLFIAAFSNKDTQDLMYPTLLLTAEVLGLDIPDLKPAKISDESIRALVGTYRINDSSARVLTFEDGKIFTQRDGGQKWEVVPMSNNGFYYEGTLTYFFIDEENGKKVMKFYTNLADKPSKAFRE